MAARSSVTVLLAFCAAAAALATGLPPPLPRALAVDAELLREKIVPGGAPNVYAVAGMRAGAVYEARISYPATNPASFRLRVLVGDSGHPGHRELLNTEKIVFAHGGDDDKPVLLEVAAEYDAFSLVAGVETQPVPYNIVVNTLVLGLPRQVWVLGAVLAVVGLVAVFVVAPVLLRWVDRTLETAKQS